MSLEEKLECELNLARLFGAEYTTKVAAVGDIPIWIIQLSVVEHIEQLRPELEMSGFRDGQNLVQSKVEVVDWRPTAVSTPGIANPADCICCRKSGAMQIVHPAAIDASPGLERRHLVRLAGILKER